jgi:hypothetical protein
MSSNPLPARAIFDLNPSYWLWHLNMRSRSHFDVIDVN